MVRKFIFVGLAFFIIFPTLVYASSNTVVARIGNNYYDTLEDAIENANSTDVIKLNSRVSLVDTILINKIINIDLNGNDISAPSAVFLVQGGTLNITGKGTIKETQPNYGAIKVIGSSDSSDNKYSVVNVGEEVFLEGWSGIFITHDSFKSYGVVVNLDGTINAVSDINGGSGTGVYVNGNIKHQTNAPVINILDNAKIISNGSGIYIAGYTILNIGKSYISGVQSGIGIKAGILNIDGATVISTGEDSTPTEGYNNGLNASGTTIQIESNNGYQGNIELNISNGNFKSENSSVVYEYIGRGNSSLVKSINISGGTFISGGSKNVFMLSDSFKQIHSNFISGGRYSTDPSSYLKAGYSSGLDDGLYSVVKSAVEQVDSDSSNISDDGNSFFKTSITLMIVAVLIILVYFNRKK